MEELPLLLGRDSYAGVPDQKIDPTDSFPARAAGYGEADLALFGEFDAVHEQVEEHLPQAGHVPDHRLRERGIQYETERKPFFLGQR